MLQKVLEVPRPLGPPHDPLPPWYNLNSHCPFHEGALGYDLDGYYDLKHKMRELIDSKVFTFRVVWPNVKRNLLPAHGGSVVNEIEKASDGYVIEDVSDVKTSLGVFHA